MSTQPDIILSSYDVANIEKWIEKSSLPVAITDGLETELARATIVKHIDLPHDRVAMGSQVTFNLEEANKTFTKTLCFPDEQAKYDDAISIFAPVGSALIGLAVGQTIEWPGQRGPQHVTITDVRHRQYASA
ncbi:GreA/GreB family elongation factor [Aliidiomarina maris]|uniref:Regulator of nucleoside diphosphate kinase n=1 Tax=Aliidiomarina maris TaxID=531312 RepID=A0A327X1F5_9GAMM|nr:GreA/GreB family elongation factor [Aliidiomarina maris]MCL5051035.1 GreA/GreB family elongation factor [Bacillota bacterium]RAJ99028.1 regulator of nucleoside diphosphate kinase [Aliidiomarina maris]RUO27808.1 transcription elongation factor GreAB [Aliidiomarina maris]